MHLKRDDLMKARIIKQERLIAAYGLDGSKLTVLASLCEREGIALRGVGAHECDCTVGFLCGLGSFSPASPEPEPPEAECLIFSGFDRRSLSETVDKLSQEGVKVPLKAVCTPSNQSWTLRALLGELAREHEYMTRNGGRR